MIICPSCGTENQEHFRFCQGCGLDISQVPRGSAPATSESAKTEAKTDANIDALSDLIGTPAVPSAIGYGDEPAPAPVAVDPFLCRACGHTNTEGNVFCGGCGGRMPSPSEPIAPIAAIAPSRAPAQAFPRSDPPGRAALDRTSLGGVSPLAAAPPVKTTKFTLTLLRVDGTDAGVFTSTDDRAVIGRESGGVFASDATLSPVHAKFERRGEHLYVTDAASLNGVFRRLVRNVPAGLEPGDGFRIGQEIMRYELVGDGDAGSDVQTIGSPRHGVRSRIVSVVGRGDYGNASSIPPTGLLLGRERGDVLFPDDGYVSGLHCRIEIDGTRALLTDLGSSNGTFLRLRTETELGANDVLLMGQQLFRIGIP